MAFYNLPTDALMEYAELATTLRDQFAKRALELDTAYKEHYPNGPVTEKRLTSLVQKRFHPKTEPKDKPESKNCKDHLAMCQLTSRKSLCDLSPIVLDDIVHTVNVDKQTHKGAADLHNVKTALVQKLMKSIRTDPEFINKRRVKQAGKLQMAELVVDFTLEKFQQREQILSSRSLADEINLAKGQELKPHFVQKVLRDGLNLKYKKFKTDAIQANSERCLVQRQQYAICMFKLLKEGKRIYNVDESWIDQMNYTR
jgi:hypothetical protein